MADSQIKAKTFSDTHSSPSDNVLENNSSTEKSNSDIGFVSTDLLSNDQNSAEPYCVENQGYIIGDIVWVKIGKFPYWPSIVCIDPESNTFTKGSLNDKKKFSLHVRFYNDNGRRSWAKIIEKYYGKEKILAKYPKCLSYIKNNKKQVQAWHLAIREADKWLKVNRDERMTQFCIAHDIKTLTPILTKQSPQLTKVEKKAKPKETRYEVSEKLAVVLRPVKGEAKKKKYIPTKKKVAKKQKKSVDDHGTPEKETNDSDEKEQVPLVPFDPNRSVPFEIRRKVEILEMKKK